ncbi:hypothetical protein HJC23_012292 [Cyclotella cryptica]|uniref:CSD domain-containing protein n=1 Tax=Cyclotella cryptica TaxID=29204 RepID=A0ABD3PN30_9STRA|eukprot:CCRYP_013478-RA/>CCRYP_013478-RA protein AED:0.16 eAED:0.16 QI:0/-1/0/1/-1/1/1/0/198
MAICFVKRFAKLASKTSPRNFTPAVGHQEQSKPSLLLGARWLSSESSSDDDIKLGTVKFFDYKKQYGFIQPDVGEKIFVHCNDIKKVDVEGEWFFTPLLKDMRVQFKVASIESGELQAREVTLEGGKPVPPFQNNHIEAFIRSRKARFGDAVFDIMDSVTDQQEMEAKIVEAFENAKNDISMQKAKVKKVLEIYKNAV